MGKVWQPKDKETLIYWFESIMDEASDKLTDWESNFLDSIEPRIKFSGKLSEKQEEILEKIYADKTS